MIEACSGFNRHNMIEHDVDRDLRGPAAISVGHAARQNQEAYAHQGDLRAFDRQPGRVDNLDPHFTRLFENDPNWSIGRPLAPQRSSLLPLKHPLSAILVFRSDQEKPGIARVRQRQPESSVRVAQHPWVIQRRQAPDSYAI